MTDAPPPATISHTRPLGFSTVNFRDAPVTPSRPGQRIPPHRSLSVSILSQGSMSLTRFNNANTHRSERFLDMCNEGFAGTWSRGLGKGLGCAPMIHDSQECCSPLLHKGADQKSSISHACKASLEQELCATSRIQQTRTLNQNEGSAFHPKNNNMVGRFGVCIEIRVKIAASACCVMQRDKAAVTRAMSRVHVPGMMPRIARPSLASQKAPATLPFCPE